MGYALKAYPFFIININGYLTKITLLIFMIVFSTCKRNIMVKILPN